MERDDFLKALHQSAKELKSTFPKRSAKWVKTISTGSSHEGNKLSRDAIYELMCCFGLVSTLKGRVTNLRLIEASGSDGFRFPMKPGSKNQFAFFRFEHQNASHDVCCGVEIPTGAGEPPEAPDISLQTHQSILPNANRRSGTPIALWDAKYHENASSKTDVQQMNWWCDIFEIPKCQAGDILSQLFPDAFQVSAVITNAGRKKFNKSQMLKRKFSVLFGYEGSHAECTPEPGRLEHERSI